MIDQTATLPAVGSGVTTVSLTLAANCFNIEPRVDAAMTCDPTTQRLGAETTLVPLTSQTLLPVPGSWPPAARVECKANVPTDMKCITGGVFILGSPASPPTDSIFNPRPERATQVSAFALDVDEFTVGQYRPLISKGLPEPALAGPTPNSANGFCAYLGKNVSSADEKSVNCIGWDAADNACKALGKRLPTEAEWEYAAGNLQLETPYPWGDVPTFCEHAVIARGRDADPTECLQQGTIALPPGPATRGMDQDATNIGSRNMAGNLTEWVADGFNAYTAPCWTFRDPFCAQSPSFVHAQRGGAWRSARLFATVFLRNAARSDGPDETVGFRCAKSL